ncbi:uncharacterized protein LOC114974804 isoform X3 [Acropora millepora]|uniref:uncharacterized protein LOC114974804 isoform X3 n=2 Tax=Acropora millepora TaxID=45264 RepID=UPI001CF34C6A|nr:uncharacterized protein LOC114974804 isoform X3 [Acropora millepora]XP_044164946.1 uncharacterized protein LOC114974804 isoform X3 [Acropora millepora]
MRDKEHVMEPSKRQHSMDEYGVGDGKKKELCQPSPEDKKPPELSFKLKKPVDVPKSTETWNDDHLPIDILLLTSVDSSDFLSCFSFLDKPFKSYKFGIGYVYFGCMGDVSDQEKLKVALMKCSIGAATPLGSSTVVQKAVRVLGPKAIFLVGTCISLGLEKARIGDVVISSRLTTTGGFKTPASPCLGNLAQDAPYGWEAPLKHPGEREITVHCNGDILSLSLREKCQSMNICEEYPEAIAIETEGEGVYAAAHDANIDWVIVKGVASYVHQSHSATSEWMSFASAMAASVVARILNDPVVFREWPHCNQENDEEKPIHPLGTTTPKRQRQNAAFAETDREISNVVEFLKKEYNRRADFSPLPWSKGMKLQLKEVYTKLRVVSKGKAEGLEIDVDDIFGSSEEDNDPLVLVEGSPGIGKTTFCLKLAHDWANGAMPGNFPSFKLVFLLKCRDIIKDVVEEIFEQLLPEDRKEKTKEALDNFLEDLNNQKQTLIILDGLDELPDQSEDRVNKVLGRKKLSFCYVLATTRQEKGIYTREQFKFNICLAIEGFSEENSFEYIRKHFRRLGAEHSSKGERLIEEIEENPLLGDIRINPLNLLLLCVVYEDHEGSLPSSSTDLYQTIVRCLLRRYCAREELKAAEKDEDLDKQFELPILALGERAWKCLLSDRLSFYEDELEEFERSNENIVARRLGLVYKEESLKRLKPRHAYSFLHKTFQEYIAASHVAHKFRGSEFQMLKQMLFPEIMRGKFKQVFVCGILGEGANIVFEKIGNMLQKQWDWSKIDHLTAIFVVDGWKETGNAPRMAKTLCPFLPFPRLLPLWEDEHGEALCDILKECAEFPEEMTVAEVHISKFTFHDRALDLLKLPGLKSVILYESNGRVRYLNKAFLEKLTFALFPDFRGSVSEVPDFGLSSVRLRICGSLGSFFFARG